MPRMESSQGGRTTSPEPYRPLPPLVDKPALSKPEPAIPWPAIPTFRVVEEEPEYDDELRPGRGREPSGEASGDYGEADYFRHPINWKREEVGNWQTVASGLNTMLFGTILGLFALVVSFLAAFPFFNNWGSHSSYYYGYGYGPNGPLGFLCFSGSCLTVSGLLFIIGQGMCCAAPVSQVRTSAVVSLVLLLISVLLMVVQTMIWSNYSTLWYRVGATSPRFYAIPGLMAVFLGAVSHVAFAKFLQDVARHFRNPSAARQAGFYLVVCIIYFAINLFIACYNLLPFHSRPYYEPNLLSSQTWGLGLCFGCFGLFIFIALISLLHQTRSLIKDRLTAGKGRIPSRHECEDMAE